MRSEVGGILSLGEELSKNTVVFDHSQFVGPPTLYEVRHGMVGLTLPHPDKKDVFLSDVYKKGDFFGYGDGLIGSNRNYPGKALTLLDSTVVTAKAIDTTNASKKNQEFLMGLIEHLDKQVGKKEKEASFMMSATPNQKVAFALLDLSVDLSEEEGSVSVTIPVVSSRIGQQRETTTRIMSSFKKRGFLERTDSTVIIDRTALKKLVKTDL